MDRPRLVRPGARVLPGGAYFTTPKSDLRFMGSGCTLLDCVLGGGWPLGRVANIIGDKSTGKTLLAIEAAANFAAQYPGGKIWYRDAEAAFIPSYAENLGLDLGRVNLIPKGAAFNTVEDWFEDLDKIVGSFDDKNEWRPGTLKKGPALYILDSLDALSDRSEMGRAIDEGSYGMGKQKKMGELFRRKVRALERMEVALIIISQVRDKIGVTFGKKHTRSGGKALDFYATHCLWLSHKEAIKQRRGKIERVTGVRIKARCEKNKVSQPFRECEFEITFSFGVDDLAASLEWLREIERLDVLGIKDSEAGKFLKEVEELPDDEYTLRLAAIAEAVRNVWSGIEKQFLPKRAGRKYRMERASGN